VVARREGTDGDGERPALNFADVLNNLSLDSGRFRRRREAQEPVEDRVPDKPAFPAAEPEDEWAGAERASEDPTDAVAVRPYAWTRGRTKPVCDLAVETLVSTSDQGRNVAALTNVEHRSVAGLCHEPRSVAEVAALLSLPLGVARVVLGDMADIGLVMVHQTAGGAGDVPDVALMERVLSGLRRL
jgi:hypothetical protein